MLINDRTNLVIALPTIGHSYHGSVTALFSMNQHLSEITVGNEVIENFTFKVLTNLNPPHTEEATFVFVAAPLTDSRPTIDWLDAQYTTVHVCAKRTERAVAMLLLQHRFTQSVRSISRLPRLLLK